MKKHLTLLLILGTVLLLAGCSALTTVQTVQPQPTAIVITSAPTTIYVVITATPAPTDISTSTPLPTETPVTIASPTPTDTAVSLITPTNTAVTESKSLASSTPTKIPNSYDTKGTPVSTSGTITIVSIKDNNSGKALITWTTTGVQNQPFWIYYSQSYAYPYYGGYPMWKITDISTRSAYLEGDAGVTYWYRICHYTGSGCDYYSNSMEYTFPAATATP